MNQSKSPLADYRATIFIFLCILAVYGLSYYKRQATYTEWMKNPREIVVDHVTAMSTKDSYHWLRMARDMDAGKQPGEIDLLKAYPDHEEYPDPNLLTRLISFSTRFTGGDYYRAGLSLVPLLAGLFVVPLFLYFNALGFGASAILGGLIGSFSLSYVSRSSFGYLDTDMLNTFFPILVSALMVLVNRERSFRGNILLTIGAGAAMYFFNWWYQQPAFFLVYLLFFAAYLFLLRLPWKQVAWLLLAFGLASGPPYVLQSVASLQTFLSAYFFPSSTGQIVWPDMFSTIAEAQKTDIVTKLERVHGFLPLVFTGLAGLIYLSIARFRQMIPIAPLILLGLWSLVGPRRFTMYLAPFIGIGAGVLIELLARQAGEKLRLPPIATPVTAISLMLVLFFSNAGYTAYKFLPPPTLPAATIRALLEIKQIVPKHSAMFSWWDNGYPLMEIGGFATYHDGSAHGRSRTTLVGKAMTSPRQEEMASLLAFLEEYGFNGLDSQIEAKNLSGDQMMDLVFNYPQGFRGENVFVLYTEDLINKFQYISTSGTWDFNRRTSEPMFYEYKFCFSQVGNVVTCKDAKIDLDRGVIAYSDGYVLPLKAALFVDNGYVFDHFDYDVAEGDYLQVLMKQGKANMFLVADERLFRTNFNQQYLLGNYDKRYFEEVYNNFPVARVFKAKTAGAGVR